MIKATIELRKTNTRRIAGLEEINQEPGKWELSIYDGAITKTFNGSFQFLKKKPEGSIYDLIACKPRYLPGETVYIKEAHAFEKRLDHLKTSEIGNAATVATWYKFNDTQEDIPEQERGRWRSPMFMPEWASRHHIKITDVRPERVQDITEEDAIREGIPNGAYAVNAVHSFQTLWNSINAKPKPVRTKGVITHYESYPWEKGTRVETYRGKPHYIYGNPWVWRKEFTLLNEGHRR